MPAEQPQDPPESKPENPCDQIHPEAPADALLARQRQDWLKGMALPVEEWLRQQGDAADPSLSAEVIYHEYLLRQERGEHPTWEEYLRRFPRQAEFLQLLYDAEQLVSHVLDQAGSPTGSVNRFGDFELLEKIGQGGMGVVYKARQDGLDRFVALKMLRGGAYADDDERHRFFGEAQAVARLQHANIVALYEVGEAEGLPFFALEFVEGESLAACLDGTPWAARPAAALTQTLARAIAYAHGRGILHRDLKPSNVLLAGPAGTRPEQRVAKLADFGLAKRLDAARHSHSGRLAGTPSYMAPEAAEPALGPSGPATDIYGLGAVLYELLTGRPPFRADSALETLRQVVHEEPAAPRLLNPAVPRDLETLCLKCLNKEPASRYPSAAALADDLQRFLEGQPVRARPVARLGRLWRWGRRNRGLASALSAVVLAVILGLAGVVYQWRQAENARRAAENSDAEAVQIFSELIQHNPGWQLYRPSGNLELRLLADVILSLPGSHPPPASGRDESAIDILRRAESHGARLLETNPQNMQLRCALTIVRGGLGTLYGSRGKKQQQAQCLAQARQLWEGLAEREPTNREIGDWLATTDLWLGRNWAGNYSQQLDAFERAQRRWQALAEETPAHPLLLAKADYCRQRILEMLDSPLAAAQLVDLLERRRTRQEKQRPSGALAAAWQQQLAWTCLLLGRVHDTQLAASQATACWSRAYDLYRPLAISPAGDLLARLNLALCCARLMGELPSDSRYRQAVHLYETIDHELGGLCRMEPQNSWLSEAFGSNRRAFALCHLRVGNTVEAMRVLPELAATPVSVGRLSGDVANDCQRIEDLVVMAQALRGTRRSVAWRLAQQADMLARQYAASPELSLDSRYCLQRSFIHLAAIQCQMGDADAGLRSAKHARRLLEQLCLDVPGLPAFRSALHDAWTRIGKARWALTRHAEALAAFRRAVALQRQVFEQAPEVEQSRLVLGRAYERLAYYSGEDRDWNGAMDAMLEQKKLWASDPKRLGVVAHDLVELAEKIGQGPRLTSHERAQRERCLRESQQLRQALQ